MEKDPRSLQRDRENAGHKRIYIESACDAILTTDLRAEVEKHTDPDAGFIPSNASKHRVPKKFSTKNPVQKFKDRNAKKLLPEKVTSEQEQDEDADNECGTSSDSDLDDEYRPAIQIQKDNDEDSTDAPDDRVPPTVEPIIPQRRVLPARKRRGKCHAIKQGMVKVNTWVFILRRYKWHIHAGSWSLVNCWREGSTLPYKGCS